MKILMYDWNALTSCDVKNMFQKMNFEQRFLSGNMMYARDEKTKTEFMEELENILRTEHYDCVFSINYFGSIASVCKNREIVYISWIYDGMILAEEMETLSYSTNRIFVFDSSEVEFYRKQGIKNIWHCNLAVDTSRLDNCISKSQGNMFHLSEISFVGSLYKTIMEQIKWKLPDRERGVVDSLLNLQYSNRNKDIISDVLSQKRIDLLVFQKIVVAFSEKKCSYEELLRTGIIEELFLDSLTYKDRIVMLSILSNFFRVDFYTSDQVKEQLRNVNIKPPIHYQTQMPFVFRNSKINLNITARRIKRGIPQRCLDIMACRGLLLTNWQEDFAGYIRDQKEALIYENECDAVEKARFFLEHDDIAEKIRCNGYEKVKECFSYEKQLRYIFDIAFS